MLRLYTLLKKKKGTKTTVWIAHWFTVIQMSDWHTCTATTATLVRPVNTSKRMKHTEVASHQFLQWISLAQHAKCVATPPPQKKKSWIRHAAPWRPWQMNDGERAQSWEDTNVWFVLTASVRHFSSIREEAARSLSNTQIHLCHTWEISNQFKQRAFGHLLMKCNNSNDCAINTWITMIHTHLITSLNQL